MLNQDRDALPHLLTRCTARLVVNRGTGETGTGFFVAPGYLFTCAHVVANASKGQATIEAVWNGKTYPATLQQITDESYPDLALLKIDGIADHPCVYLFDEIHLTDELYTYGYPPKYPAGDSIISRYVGPTGEPQVLLTFTESNVRRGFSGSPLLNLRTGAVCGLIKLTTGENSPLGGRGIPIAQALQAFPQIKDSHDQFHRENHEWARCLTLQQRQVNGLNKLAPQTEAVTLFLSYHPNKKDTRMFRELLKHLAILRRKRLIDTWYEGKTVPEPGIEPMKQVMQHLVSSQVIVLFISPDYMDDDTLYDVHVTTAMTQHQKKAATVLPVYLRSIIQPTNDRAFTPEWKELPFGELVVLPRNFKPVDEWDNKDLAFSEIASEIRKVVEKIKRH